MLAAAGGWCATRWYQKKGPVVAGSLLAGYLVAFGASHPLAKKVGAWPSVFAVTTAAAGAAYAVADR